MRPTMPTRLVVAGQCEQVVSPEKWLEDDVVERERQRRPEDDERALRALEGQFGARAERDDDRDAGERDGETDDAPHADAVETERERQEHGESGRQSDDERRDCQTSCGARRGSGTCGSRRRPEARPLPRAPRRRA
jgi:hypothetical protein